MFESTAALRELLSFEENYFVDDETSSIFASGNKWYFLHLSSVYNLFN